MDPIVTAIAMRGGGALRSSSNLNERGIMSRVFFVLIGVGALVPGVLVSADEIDVDFTRQSYDRWLFRPEAGLDGGHWIPRATACTPPCRKVSRPAVRFDSAA